MGSIGENKMELKDLLREKMLAEIISERDDIILNQQKIIEELKKEIEFLKMKS